MCFKVVLVTLAAVSVESLPQFFQPQFGSQRQFTPVYEDESVYVDRRSLPQHSFNSPNLNQDFGLNGGQYSQYESLKRQPSESFENRHTSVDLSDYPENYGSDTFEVQSREEHLTDHYQNDFSNSGARPQRNKLLAAQPLHTQHNTDVRNFNSQNNDYDYRRTEKPVARNPGKIESRVSQNVDVTTTTYQNSNNNYSNEDQYQNKQKPNENQFPKNNSVQNIEVIRTNKTQQRDKINNRNKSSKPATPNVRQEDSRQGDNRKTFDTNTHINNESYHNSNINNITLNLTDTDNIYSNADKLNDTHKQDKVNILTNIQEHGSNTTKQKSRPLTSESVDKELNDSRGDAKNEVQKPSESDSKHDGLPQRPEEEDKWIWGYSGVVKTEAPLPNSTVDLDDRASFDAAMCPAGKIKVEGMCVKVDM